MIKLGFALAILGAVCGIVLSKSAPLRIQGGTDAQDGEFPYMVSINGYFGCFVCGGSIIAEKWILTAGHCVYALIDSSKKHSDEHPLGDKGVYTVVYGNRWIYECQSSVNNKTDMGVRVKALHQHPKWDHITGVPFYDVGLLELEDSISYSDLVQPITLADSQEDLPVGTEGSLSGWGSAIVDTYPTPNLQKLQTATLSNDECSAKIDDQYHHIRFNAEQFFCTNDYEHQGACSGDSGSPWVVNGVQHGIMSWSINPCGEFPSVYAKVALSENREWIRNVTGV